MVPGLRNDSRPSTSLQVPCESCQNYGRSGLKATWKGSGLLGLCWVGCFLSIFGSRVSSHVSNDISIVSFCVCVYVSCQGADEPRLPCEPPHKDSEGMGHMGQGSRTTGSFRLLIRDDLNQLKLNLKACKKCSASA